MLQVLLDDLQVGGLPALDVLDHDEAPFDGE
jgi:hypothetical protein